MPTDAEISSAYARSRAEFDAAGTTFEQAAPMIRDRLIASRRRELIADWVSDLAAATDVVILNAVIDFRSVGIRINRRLQIVDCRSIDQSQIRN